MVSTTRHRSNGGDFTAIDSLSIGPADVANLMVLLKVARSVHGDPTQQDHYVDMAGYASLAGALSMGEKRAVLPNSSTPQAAENPELTAARKEQLRVRAEAEARSTNTTLAAARAVDASEQK